MSEQPPPRHERCSSMATWVTRHCAVAHLALCGSPSEGRPGIRLARCRSRVQAGARAQSKQRGCVRPVWSPVLGPRAARRSDRTAAARTGARPVREQDGRCHRLPPRGSIRRSDGSRNAFRRSRPARSAWPLHVRLGLSRAREARAGIGGAGAGGGAIAGQHALARPTRSGVRTEWSAGQGAGNPAAFAGAIYGIKGSFLFALLRLHPRFVALLRRMHLA